MHTHNAVLPRRTPASAVDRERGVLTRFFSRETDLLLKLRGAVHEITLKIVLNNTQTQAVTKRRPKRTSRQQHSTEPRSDSQLHVEFEFLAKRAY